MMKLSKISFNVANRAQPIINNMSFEVNSDDFIVLLGSNGSGKSTLIKLMNRSYKLRSGEIDFLGQSLSDYSNKELASSLMTITQNARDNLFLDMTIAENAILYELRYQSLNVRVGHSRQMQQELQEYLAQFSHKLVHRLNTKVGLLSGGEQQILILALCLRYPPKLLLLDEHTSALDPKTAESMMEKTYQATRERGVTCVMTTHNLSFAMRYGNRLIALEEGKINFVLNEEEKAHITREKLLRECY